MSTYQTDSTPIDLPRLEKEIGALIYWFDSLDADKQKKYSAQMDYINQSIEKILNNHPISQDHAKWTQNKANETTVAVSALYNEVIPLLAEFKGLGDDQASGGRRRIKKRTRRHKKKRGKKTRGKKMRKL